MNNESSGCYVIDAEYNIINVNSVAKKIYPQLEIGKKCYKCLMNLDEPCGPCPVVAGRKGPTSYVDPIRHITEVVDAVDIDIDGGECHALIFSTVENEASFAATLPTSAEDLKNLALVKALTVDYVDVFSVNLQDENTTMYRLNGRPLDASHEYINNIPYPESVEEYITKYVYEEDKDTMREQSNLLYIENELKKVESFKVHYRVLLNGEIHHYYRKIARVGNPETFDNIVIGVGCEDEEVLNRERQTSLENVLSKVEMNSTTGLLNREAFLIYGDNLLKQNPDKKYDFGILTIDNMDSLSRQYGPIAKEKFRHVVGTALKRHANENVCMAYLGSNTFGSFSLSTEENIRKQDIKGFCEEINQESDIKNYQFKWTFYKNLSHDEPIEQIVDKVMHMLQIIRPGIRDEYFEFDRSIMEGYEWDFSVEQNFRNGIKKGEFVAWLQPKYSVDTREIVGAEALARWVTQDGKMIPPNRFIPILESSGLISQLDEEIFRQACKLQIELKEAGMKQIPISVNLSRASLFVKDIPNVYSKIAEEYGVDTSLIPIEITESAAIRAAMFKSFAEELIGKGFPLHMDDFGSGYSSLASVQVIPFESIKIDKLLIDFIGKKSGESLLKHTIEFARENGISVIAEGVETDEQLMFLRIVGCDSVQGFLFSKPVEKIQFMNMLRK